MYIAAVGCYKNEAPVASRAHAIRTTSMRDVLSGSVNQGPSTDDLARIVPRVNRHVVDETR